MSDLAMTLASRLDEIERLANMVELFGARHRLPDDLVFALNLALDEVITNVILYAYPDTREHQIHVSVAVRNETVRAEVRDDGRAFDPLGVAPPDLDAPIDQRAVGGLGLHIVRSVMDTVNYRRDGEQNVLTLTRRFSALDEHPRSRS